jgi:23S rRNA (guanosine2251-2'-O)-methyltransferase
MSSPGRGRRPARGGRGGDPARRSGRSQTPASQAPASKGGGRGSPAGGGDRPARRRSSTTGLGGQQVEGRHAVRELLLAGRRRVHEIWILADAEPSPVLGDIRELAAGERIPVREVGRGKFFAEARCEAPQGVLAKASPLPEVDLDELAAARPGAPVPFLVAVDGVTDPGNLGALLRSAECAGATGVILPRHRAVHVTPTVTKAAAGAVEHLRFSLVGGLPAALARLRQQGTWAVGLDGSARDRLWDLAMGDEPITLVLGSEGRGLSRLVRERCDALVAIPLIGRLGSLNVAAAAALACYEVARRRTASPR